MNTGITEEQSKMIDLIIQGRNITDIAGIVHKSRTTIYNWLELDVVKEELENRRSEMKKAANNKIVSEANNLVDNMINLAMNSSDTRVKFQANKYLIDQCLGTPVAAKEDVNNVGNDKDNKDANTLKQELDDIKNFKVVK